MGIEHVTKVINKPTDRGCIAYAHTEWIANTYHHWPKEAHEATQARLPTLRVLSYIRNIPGAELERIHYIQTPNQIAITIRAASEEVDRNIATQRQHIPKNLQTKDYTREVRTKCQPLKYADILFQHLAPYGRRG
jgi:hypothetical protein